jgi:hypothetical protein
MPRSLEYQEFRFYLEEQPDYLPGRWRLVGEVLLPPVRGARLSKGTRETIYAVIHKHRSEMPVGSRAMGKDVTMHVIPEPDGAIGILVRLGKSAGSYREHAVALLRCGSRAGGP